MVEEIPEIAPVTIAFHAIMLSIVVQSVNCSITELDTRGHDKTSGWVVKAIGPGFADQNDTVAKR
jgi:hypothetical protein